MEINGTCSTCRWWIRPANRPQVAPGECRGWGKTVPRYAWVNDGYDCKTLENYGPEWPATFGHEFCRAFEARERPPGPPEPPRPHGDVRVA